jgi:ubiquinone/menaquinone biosynthesis C-methylase UbiE
MPNTLASSTIVPPDVASSSHAYAKRFSSSIGEHFLKIQGNCLKEVTSSFFMDNPNPRVLDLGGGHCQLLDFYLKMGCSITIQGSDERSFQRAIDLGYDKNPNISFRISPLDKLNFEDYEFDLVSAFRLMAHVNNWRSFLKEMLRVSKEGIVFDYAKLYTTNILSPLLFQIKKSIEGNTRPFYCQSKGEVIKELRSLGCNSIISKDQFAFPMGLHRLIKKPEISQKIEETLSTIGLDFLKTPGVVFATK